MRTILGPVCPNSWSERTAEQRCCIPFKAGCQIWYLLILDVSLLHALKIQNVQATLRLLTDLSHTMHINGGINECICIKSVIIKNISDLIFRCLIINKAVFKSWKLNVAMQLTCNFFWKLFIIYLNIFAIILLEWSWNLVLLKYFKTVNIVLNYTTVTIII